MRENGREREKNEKKIIKTWMSHTFDCLISLSWMKDHFLEMWCNGIEVRESFVVQVFKWWKGREREVKRRKREGAKK